MGAQYISLQSRGILYKQLRLAGSKDQKIFNHCGALARFRVVTNARVLDLVD
jgi:hypothetical protein